MVRVPKPKLTCPVPESVSPPVRLMAPPAVAVITPWQLRGPVIVAAGTLKPCPAGTVNVDPLTYVMPGLSKTWNAAEVDAEGTITRELAPA